eukprot:scaffold434787_cov53-Prasinocladus_malaysianus.AAC.1
MPRSEFASSRITEICELASPAKDGCKQRNNKGQTDPNVRQRPKRRMAEWVQTYLESSPSISDGSPSPPKYLPGQP